MPPDDRNEARVTRTLDEIAARLRARAILRTISVALSAGIVCWAVLVLAGLPSIGSGVVTVTTALALSMAWLARTSNWSRPAAACAFERAYPASHNVVITAEELLRRSDRARPWVVNRVVSDAAEIMSPSNRAVVVPLRRDTILVALAALLSVVVVVASPQRVWSRTARSHATETSRAGDTHRFSLSATVTPPAYIGSPPWTIENPARIDALQGSRLHLEIRGEGQWRARFGSEPLGVIVDGGRSAIDLPLDHSGYLAIEHGANSSAARLLIPIAIAPDRAPSIRISAPAKDLLLPDVRQTIGIEASATDDFALQSLELRYTKVSGSGEQFEFNEGSIPLSVAPRNDREWDARGQLKLAQLALAAGDSIIYRIVGRDRRPGEAGVASSDTYFVEIAGPGQVALEGFEMPPDRERYALSQQMIVLKLERLRARERTLDRATLEQEIGNIAAEQRAVRANFVFLTGGHVEDEEEEAEQSHEIQEGRLENTAHREIVAAIQFMSRAEQGMAAVSTSSALPPARSAVAALQRAFGRNRYFLRTVPVRSRIDPTRRASGDVSTAADWRREVFPVPLDGPDAAARAILARLLDVLRDARAGSLPPAALTAIAEEALAVDPSSTEWQTISTNLQRLRDSAGGDRASREQLATAAVRSVVAVVQRTAPTVDRRPSSDALRSAWAEVRR